MWMSRFLIRFLFFLLLIIQTYSFEYENSDTNDGRTEDRAYDLDGVFRKGGTRFQNVRKFKVASSARQLEQPDLEKYVLEPSAILYENSSKCFDDLLYTVQNLKAQWALQMLDSYGKPSSGILQGDTKWIGDYSECIQVQAPPSPNSTAGNFRGKYCSLIWAVAFANFSLSVTSGVCIPSTCSPPEIQAGTPGPMPFLATDKANISNETGPILQVIQFKCKPTERSLNTPAKAVIALLSVFCIPTVLGSLITVIKYFKGAILSEDATPLVNSSGNIQADNHFDSLKKKEDLDHGLEFQNRPPSYGFLKMCENFLGCFCIFKNGTKILNTNTGEGELLCIHGIRFLSMSWVILGHTYVFCMSEIRNFMEVIKVVDDFAFQIILQGFYSVDSFFVLSGFLLTYLSMQEYSKKGGIFWPYFYIHRYIRLTPVYMLTLGFSATAYFYLGSGPFWPDSDFDPICRDDWWRNLLYINNFSDMAKQCMGWSWYLANDMQFFVISPLFLITLWRWPVIGYCLLAVFLCASFLANFFITYHFDLLCGALGVFNSNVDMLTVMNKIMLFFDKVYIKPYTRIGPYLIGILLGYVLFTRKINKSPKHNWVFLCLGWVIASSVTLTCVYGLYHANPSLFARSTYNALNRTCFAMGLCWVIYVCLIGQGGFVNSILSYKLFIPLSRLTYVAYLIHPMIITGYFASLKTSLTFTHPTMVFLFLGMLVMSYAVALPVALVFESSIISLEKFIRNSLTKAQRTEPTN